MPPLDIMVMERKQKYEGVAKEDARRNLMTHYFITQALSEQRSFHMYLLKGVEYIQRNAITA